MERIANEPVTTLNGGINNSVTSLVLTSPTGFPSTGNFRIRIDDEIMLVTDVSGSTLTVVRGQEGTSAASHSNLAPIRHILTAESLSTIIAEAHDESLFVNSNYDHWQRVESNPQTVLTSFNQISSFGPDRMFTLPAGASVTVSRSTTVRSGAKGEYSCQIDGAASATTVDHGQRLRSTFRSRYKTRLLWMAWVFNGSGADFTPKLRVDTPSALDNWASSSNRLDQSLQLCVDNQWTLCYHVFDPSGYTNIDNGISVYLRIPSGSLVTGDVVRIAEHTLVPSERLVPYRPPDRDRELIRCLPYYRKSYSDGVTLASNTAVGLVGAGSHASGAANWYIRVYFGIPMWRTPQVRLWDRAGTGNQFYNPVTDTNHVGVGAANISPSGFELRNHTTAAENVFAHYDAVAEVV